MAGGLVLPLLNCGASAHDPTEVYYLVTIHSKISYWQAAAAGIEQAGRELKVRWETVGPEDYDPQAQKEEFQKVLSQHKPTGILVSPANPELMTPVIDAAIAQGVPVITMDSDAPASKRLMFIGTDNYGAGQMGAKIVAKERLHGYEEVFRGYPGIKIAEVVDMKGDPTIAFDKTSDILTKNTPVDAFACLEAQSCAEVAEVLSRKQTKGKTVVAMDTDPRTLESIQKGLIVATIAQKPFTMAYFGTLVLDQLHHNLPPTLGLNWAQDTRSPVPRSIDTGTTLIDKSNVDKFLKADSGLQKGN
jgi:ribose transport system substrate-binding protein